MLHQKKDLICNALDFNGQIDPVDSAVFICW